MGKRGFSLVEMLAVVVILGLLIVVGIPQIQNQLLSKKEAVNEATLALIYEAAESYVDANPSTFQKMYISESEHASYCISLKKLVDEGKLESPIKDYSTGEDIDLNTFIEINSNEYNEFIYELKEGECSKSATIVDGEVYKDIILNGNDPVLSDGMIPVVYDKNSNSWVKADTYKGWYNYSTSSKQWANAVTVNKKASTCDGDECIDSIEKHTRIGYERAIPGTKISMDDINAMYVWIPKYYYTVNTTNKNFNIKFEATSNYTAHPAFGSKTGMWVAKFEASAKRGSLCETENNLDFCNNSYVRIASMPNKNSLRYISIGNAMATSKGIATAVEEYGLDEMKVDTHLIKNTEWGAVAYLTRSDYGIGTSKEIYVNRYYDSTNQLTRTGCTSGGAGTGKAITTSCIAYNEENSLKGTTTGNIYGIYDMSGGAWEFVAGNYNSKVSVAGLESIDTNYINVYTQVAGCAESVCPGAALSTTKNWLDDEYLSSFTNTNSWLIRGGYWGATDSKLLGSFAVSVDDGDASPNISFRPVITKK